MIKAQIAMKIALNIIQLEVYSSSERCVSASPSPEFVYELSDEVTYGLH